MYLDICGLMTECRDLTSPGNKQNETTFQAELHVEIHLIELLKTLLKKKILSHKS